MAEHCKISAALVADSEERSYVIKIDGYLRAKALMKPGKFVTSTPFNVGGHSWAVACCPNGCSEAYAGSKCVFLYLLLESADAEEAKAKFTISILDKNGNPSLTRTFPMHTFTRKGSCRRYPVFFIRFDLGGKKEDDCLTIRCDITVMKEIQSQVQIAVVPPSDLHRHLGDLLKNKDAADVTFQVGGQSFSAHRCVLAARSSVFKVELLGAMKESSGSPIEIHNMEADVFESFLHFIYTDKVPSVLDCASNIVTETEASGDLVMAGHLLVAADRYDIGRLKLICEEKLCNHIDSDMVATTLALAEQHGFHRLKEACLKFLSSPSNLEAMMASDGFEHLKSSCPSILKELIARIQPAELKAAKSCAYGTSTICVIHILVLIISLLFLLVWSHLCLKEKMV